MLNVKLVGPEYFTSQFISLIKRTDIEFVQFTTKVSIISLNYR